MESDGGDGCGERLKMLEVVAVAEDVESGIWVFGVDSGEGSDSLADTFFVIDAGDNDEVFGFWLDGFEFGKAVGNCVVN